MNKIEFNGKKLSLFEAKLYLVGLNWGIINPTLNKEEEGYYKETKTREEYRLNNARRLLGPKYSEDFKKFNTKKFWINKLEKKIQDEEKSRATEQCTKKGHKKGKYLGTEKEINYYLCPRCNSKYEGDKPDETKPMMYFPFVG